MQSLLAGASGVSSLAPAVEAVGGALSELEQFVQIEASRSPSSLELAARDLAYSLARIYAGGYFSGTSDFGYGVTVPSKSTHTTHTFNFFKNMSQPHI